MENARKTLYSLKDNVLYRCNKKTEVYLQDYYFCKGGIELGLYVEDGALYREKAILPFFGIIRVSKPTGLVLGEDGTIWIKNGAVNCLDDITA